MYLDLKFTGCYLGLLRSDNEDISLSSLSPVLASLLPDEKPGSQLLTAVLHYYNKCHYLQKDRQILRDLFTDIIVKYRLVAFIN